MAEVASAYVSLMPSAKGFGSKLDSQISGDISKSGKKAGIGFGKLFAAGAALGLGAKAFSFLGDSLAEATDAQVIGARTENVIKKMGGAANVTAKQVGNLAGAISKKTGIDDEAIQAGQNMLLTFGKVRNETGKGNDVFDQTSRLMVDMSAAMGTDAKSAALQLGKALNDPTEGVSKLTRSGVSFTDQQKEQIKTLQESGNMLGAQKVILGEVKKQFGGAAEAMATPADKAKVAFGNLQEQIGTAVLPIVEKLSNYFTTKVAPAISTFVTQMQNGKGAGGEFRDALTSAKDAVVQVADAVKSVVGFLNQHRTAVMSVTAAVLAGVAAYKAFMFINTVMTAVKTGIILFKAWRAGTLAQTAAQLGLNAALVANPIGIVVVAVAALVAGFVVAYKKSETFRTIVDKALTAVGDAGKWLWNNALKPAFEGIKKGFEAVGKAGTWLWNNALQPAFHFIVSGVASILDMWASMLRVLGKVPGFGWAKDAADSMANAADKARAMADGIKKIPPRKDVKIVVTYAYQGQRNQGKENQLDFAPRISGSGNAGAKAFNRVLKEYGAGGKRLMDAIDKGIKSSTPKVVAAAQDAFDSLKSKIEAKRDEIKSTLDGLKDQFAGIRDSVSQAFAGNLFDVEATDTKTIGQSFIDNLMSKKSELTGLLSSFNILKGWGVDPGFLTQLFASGQGALITELAGMGQAGAVSTANLFGEVTNLGTQLGNAVASNDPVAAEMVKANQQLGQIVQALGYLGGDIGKALDEAAGRAHRAKKNRSKKK